MSKMMIWAAVAAGFLLGGCNTMVGVGRDLEAIGQAGVEYDREAKANAAARKKLSPDNPYR